MSKFALRPWIAIALLALLPWLANAAGLGKLTVLSSLGQPFDAEIDVVSAQKGEFSTLAARLASPESYQQANLQYPPGNIGLRFSVEKRPNGEPFIKVTSSRPVNEPVVDLLLELAWSSGRISRAYTALIDPPGYGESAPPQRATAPEARPIAAPAAKEAPAVAERPGAARAEGGGQPGQYGPIKRGETLARVAGAVKPDGVTLEQMLVGLYRNNPDAFVSNMNRMKTGRILKIPAKEELTAVTPVEAKQEVRVQASDWNAYRRKLAETAGTVPEERGTTASGRITARAEDRGAGEPDRDVVRLSKGEPAGGIAGQGKARSSAQRLRALEEEAIAREKALSEANERIAELEKTIKDQQSLLALKGAPSTAQPAAKPAPTAAAPTTPEPAKPAATPAPTDEGAKVPAPAATDPTKAAPAPKPKPKVVAPPPAPEPDFLDTLLGEPLYLAAGAGVILLAGFGVSYSRRRRNAPVEDEEPVKVSPVFHAAAAAATPPPADEVKSPEPHVDTAPPAGEPATDEVDALAEAEVYIAYGRDAQAEQILKEALAASPSRQEVILKLLEIYAARKDRRAFAEFAGKLRQVTGGSGDSWNKAAAMGAAIDPTNALYQAGGAASLTSAEEVPTRGLEVRAPAEPPSVASAEPVATPQTDFERTIVMAPEAAAQAAAAEVQSAPAVPEFTLEVPPAETSGSPAPAAASAPAETAPAPSASDSNVIDFKIELPPLAEPKAESPAPAASAPTAASASGGLDFKLDFSDINLHLDDKAPAPASAAAGEAKDAHWHDVQQKFDLAKAYEEMGDKDGAREVLQEVVSEGDSEQQTQAKKLLGALA